MANKSTKPQKTRGGGGGTAATKRAPSSRNNSRLSVDKRLNAVFDSITEELLTTLEHNYDRNKR